MFINASALRIAAVVSCQRLCSTILPQYTACSNGWYSKRPSYQLALVDALSTRISTLLAWFCTRHYTLPRLAGLLLYLHAIATFMADGESIMVAHARRRHPRQDPPCCIQYTALLLVSMCCCCSSSCMHVYAVSCSQ